MAPTRLSAEEAVPWEFERLFDLVRQTIECIPDAEWSTGRDPFHVPARQVCHIVGFFAGYGGFWLARSLTGRVPPGEIPSKDGVVARLDEVKQKAVSRASELMQLAVERRGRYPSPVTNLLYEIEHAVLHLGYLRAELKSRGIRFPALKQRLRLTDRCS